MTPDTFPAEPAILPLLAPGGGRRGETWPRLAILIAWLAVAAWLASRHVMWRDEVRALTLALSGDTVPAMLVRVHGEGHPAIWYLLLRGAHAIFGVRDVLPGVAFAIGGAAAALFAWRAPFRPLVVALVLFGAYFVHEYTIVARNYGISMLLLFAFAALYGRWRQRGVGLGVVLALLCNTNVPSVMLAGGLGLFWGVELVTVEGWRWTPAWRRYAINMGLALAGVVACVAEVYPPFNDAAVSPMAGRMSLATAIPTALDIISPMSSLVPELMWGMPLAAVLLTAMVVGSPLGLLRSPGGLIAGLLMMVAMPAFFHFVYPGEYRHQALAVVFLVTLYWLVAEGHGGRWPTGRAALIRPGTQAAIKRIGQGALLALLATQAAIGIGLVGAVANGLVFSRSGDLAALLARDHLERAVVMAHPDVLIEPLSYYSPNPTWLIRAKRWGRVAPFTKATASQLDLAQILVTARALHAHTHRPVVIVLQTQLDPAARAQVLPQGYLGSFAITPTQVRAFLGATRRLARFGPAQTDERYDVYQLIAA